MTSPFTLRLRPHPGPGRRPCQAIIAVCQHEAANVAGAGLAGKVYGYFATGGFEARFRAFNISNNARCHDVAILAWRAADLAAAGREVTVVAGGSASRRASPWPHNASFAWKSPSLPPPRGARADRYPEVSEVIVPGYLAAMVRRVPPAGAPVVAGSTPVVSFGDPRGAIAATVGINPSAAEFTHKGQLLAGGLRRLATLESLQAQRCDLLSDSQVGQAVADCASYFTRRPYVRWFQPLEAVLHSSLEVSYCDGSACHLDLIQWATDPVWGQIADPRLRQILLDDGVPHLRAHLRQGTLRVVLLNGRTVVDQAERADLVSLSPAGTLALGHTTCSLYSGSADGVRFLGWSANLQGSHGVTAQFRESLAAWIATSALTVSSPRSHAKEIDPMHDQDQVDAHRRFLPKWTTVRGKQELAVLLGDWLGRSSAPTIGDVGSYGGQAWVWIELSGRRAHLNADTSRSAVRNYLDHVRSHGADANWHVVANRNGRINKVLFAPPGSDASGWYCYLTAEYATPGRI